MRPLGLVFNRENQAYCTARGLKSDSELIASRMIPWDSSKQPAIISFDDWAKYLKPLAATRREYYSNGGINVFFWEIVNDIDTLFGTTQQQNDCAAWATERCITARILHQIIEGAEMTPQRFNPMALYAYSSDNQPEVGQRIQNTGRTLYAVANASNAIGSATAGTAGEYDGRVVYTQKMLDAKKEAADRQLGWALYDTTDKTEDNIVDDIFDSLATKHPVLIGNTTAVQDGTIKDANGVYIGQVNGMGWGGGHATSFLDYRVVNNTEYVFWANSHGNIYHGIDASPDWGCWLTKGLVKSLMGGRYFDIVFSTWAEAPHLPSNYNLASTFYDGQLGVYNTVQKNGF